MKTVRILGSILGLAVMATCSYSKEGERSAISGGITYELPTKGGFQK